VADGGVKETGDHFRRILMATDFSPTAAHAAQVAARLSGSGATLRIVTVRHSTEPHLALVNPSRSEVRKMQKQHKNRANQAAKDLEQLRKKLDRPDAEIAVLVGSVGRAVVDEARRWKADLVVAAASSNDEHKEVFGTKARAILRNASCDVLFVRPGKRWDDEGWVPRVAVATDFQASSKEAGRVALSLSARLRARLVAVHVMDRHLWIDMLAERGTGATGKPGATWSTMQQRLTTRLHEFNRDVLEGKAKELLETGDPHAEIAKIAAHNDVDLLVLGSQGDRVAGSVNLGSVAAEVAATAPMSVLLVR
jgi:nucleotide-binding universal stress UspA family protein